MKTEKNCGVGGRPRSFCVETALDRAIRVFWQKGFDGASLTDLTEAMGINRPSLYATYGNKETLFLKALERYFEINGAPVMELLQQPKLLEAIGSWLHRTADTMTCPEKPPGCLGVQGALSCSEEASTVKEVMAKHRQAVQQMIIDRIARSKNDGELSSDADPDALGKYLISVMYGLSVQATSGATNEDLHRIVDQVLQGISPLVTTTQSP